MLCKHPDSLSGFTPVEETLLDEKAFSMWQARIQRVAESIQAAQPEFNIRPYQVNNAAMFCLRRRNIMAHVQGAGKTFVSGMVLAGLYSSFSRPGQVQIVACSPLSAEKRWLEDLNRIPALRGNVAIVTNPKQLPDAPIWIYTCDFLRRRVLKRTKQTRCSAGRFLGETHRPAFLIVDEIHLFQPRTQRTLALDYLCKRARRVLSLSGTLTDGRLDLIHSAAQLTYQQQWPYRSQSDFNRDFSSKQRVSTTYVEDQEVTERYLQQLSLYKLPEYYSLARRFIHRLTLNDPSVMPYIKRPLPVSQVHLVKASKEHQLAYQRVVEEHFTQLETLASLEQGGNPSTFAFIWKLFYASNAPWLEHGIIEPNKAKALLELVQQHTKTAVFTTSVDVGRWLDSYLKEHLGPEHVVRLYAQDEAAEVKRLSDSQRVEVLDRYCYSPDVKVGVFSLNLASMSIDMLSTDHIVFWDLPATAKPLPVQQAITRAVRPGNPLDTVKITYLVHESMLDYHTFCLLGHKLQNARLLMDYDLEHLQGVDVRGADASTLAKAILGIH